jgi:hypothetical protein
VESFRDSQEPGAGLAPATPNTNPKIDRDGTVDTTAKKKRRKAHIFKKEAYGHYVEPAWCSERLFDVEKFAPVIFDPACGWGTILHAARAAGYDVCGGDIVDRRRHGLKYFSKHDFLKLRSIDANKLSIVSNPPFDHVQEFCEHALHLGMKKVAMIMLVRRLNAAHWLRDLPLKTVYLLSPRPSMPPGAWIAAGNKPGGGTQDFCFLVFDRRYKGEPKLKWLYRDKSQRASVMNGHVRCRSGPSAKPNRSVSTLPRNSSKLPSLKSISRKS